MEKIELKTNDWVRQIREANYQLLQGKSYQERMAFYREGSDILRLKIQEILRKKALLHQ